MKISFLEPAREEFEQAIAYYKTESPRLGHTFRVETLNSLSRIALFPDSFQPFTAGTRRCLIAGFPYGIIYYHDTETDEIVVLAVAHLRRKPGYWLTRT